jgi:hypothetical protein
MTITDVEYYLWSYKMPSRQLVNVDSSLLRSNWHIKSSKLPISLLLESLTTQCHVSAFWIISHFGSTRHVNSRDYGFRMVYVVYGSAETEGRHDVVWVQAPPHQGPMRDGRSGDGSPHACDILRVCTLQASYFLFIPRFCHARLMQAGIGALV